MMTAFYAGLTDSLSPGALTAVIVFVLFLTIVFRTREEAFIGATVFISTVFSLTLFSLLGVFDTILFSVHFYRLSKIAYISLGSLFLFLGLIYFYDWRICGKYKDTERCLIRWPYLLAESARGASSHVALNFSAWVKTVLTGIAGGCVASVLELIWPPHYAITIMFYDLGSPGKAMFTLLSFCFYSLIFVSPLIIVLFLLLWALKSEKFFVFLRQSMTRIKTVCSALFLAFGLGLIYLVIKIF